MRSYIVSAGLLAVLFALLFGSAIGDAHQGWDQITPAPEPAHAPQRSNIIVELESEPLTVYRMKLEAIMQSGQRLDSGSQNTQADRQTQLQTDLQIHQNQLEAEHQQFTSKATLVASDLKINTELHRLLNAVSLEIDEAELPAITQLAGVRRVWKTKDYHATLNTSVSGIHAPDLWERLGGAAVAGDGIRIAILDTGIDITNPLFSGAGFIAPAGFPRGNVSFTNNKVIVAKTFLADFVVSPRDEFGHGSHVAGIAAGNFNTATPLARLSGVAPRAFLGNYRVLDRNGVGRDDFIIRALEEAVEDGFEVINLSFGGEAAEELGALDLAVENAVAAGVIVVAAAGNDGLNGSMTIASPGIAPSAITVGATTNGHLVGEGATVSVASLAGFEATRGETNGFAIPIDSNMGALPLIDTDAVNGGSRGCVALPAGSLTGAIALVERGNCSFADKVNQATAAGARAVIIFNDDNSAVFDSGDNLLFMDVTGTRIPSVFIKRSDGLALREWVRSHSDTQVQITPTSLKEISFPADVLAEYSSHGPSGVHELKPDLTAPGDSIYSAAIRGINFIGISDASGFRVASGTSQATAHVAGAAALLKQLHPSFSPEQIKSLLINSAPNLVFASFDRRTKAGVLDGGSGRPDLSQAAAASATFSPPGLSFGFIKLRKNDAEAILQLKITNDASSQREFRISVEQADPGDGFRVTAKPRIVSLKEGETATVKVRVSAVAGVTPRRDYTGYIVCRDHAAQSFRVPYWIRFIRK